MAIRYDKKLNNEINNVIRRFNSKITRLSNMEKDYILPQKISKKELKDTVYTRRELRRKLSEYNEFTKRGAEETLTTSQGYSISKYEYDRLRRETTRIKKELTRQLKRFERTSPTVYGEKQGFTFAQMGDSMYLNIKAKRELLNRDILKMDRARLETYKTTISILGRSKVMLDMNFKANMDDMINKLAYHVGYDEEKANLLREKLGKLSPEKFYQLYQNEKSIKTIIEQYDVAVGKIGKVDPKIIEEDVTNNYDDLITNIDDIIADYL